MTVRTLDEITNRLRDHVLGALHLGELEAGSRLPSIRRTALEMGEDQRRIAKAYRVLEAEGLVEVRGQSGVYAAPQPRLRDGMFEETAEWLSSTFLEGWKRRLPPARVAALVEVCAQRRVRCALVDSCEDVIVAFEHELREELGFDVAPVWLSPGEDRGEPGRAAGALRDADVIVTTVFNATSVRRLAQKMGLPVVVVSVHPQISTAIMRQISQGSLTIVCADPQFGDRLRIQYADKPGDEDRLRVVLAEDRDAVASLDPCVPVVLTRAARRRLGHTELKLLVAHSPTLSPESAQELIRLMVRLSREGGESE